MLNEHLSLLLRRLMGTLIALLSSGVGVGTVSAAQAVASQPAWTRAEYAAHKFFITARVDVELSVQPAVTVIPQLVPVTKHVALPAGSDGVIVSQITNTMLSQKTTLKLWARSDMQVLQRTALYTGRKYWYRMFRYAEDGVYSLKRRPLDGEQEQEITQWSEVNEDYYPHAPEAKSQILMEPELLFYYLAVTPMSASSPGFDFIAVDRSVPMRVSVKVAGTRQIDHNYVLHTAQGEQRHEDSTTALHLRIQVTPLAAGTDAGELKFLGLNGEIEMMLDTQRRIILELRGDADKAGEVRFMLRRVDMR